MSATTVGAILILVLMFTFGLITGLLIGEIT